MTTSSRHGLLLVDVGNTRIKWRLLDRRRGWTAHDRGGNVVLAGLAELANAWRDLTISDAFGVCVADDATFEAIASALFDLKTVRINRVVSDHELAGMINDYREPRQLGSDRWVQAIGACALFPRRILVIASLGTATTVDVVVPEVTSDKTQRAHFRGGVILPGIELMRTALAQGTARLPLADGQFVALADNTDDAITSGILHAQAGAIEGIVRAAIRLDPEITQWGSPLCLVGGGAAAHIAPLLARAEFPAETEFIDDMVLRGLARIAGVPQDQYDHSLPEP